MPLPVRMRPRTLDEFVGQEHFIGTGKLLRRGHHIHEVPIWYQPRKEKKLSPWKDGLPALWTLVKYRFTGGQGP